MPKAATYCVMPHISLAMQNDGDVCVCNVNTESFKHNKTHNVIFLHQDGLETSWKSYTRKIIAAALDRGIKLPSCNVCWGAEEAGNVSPRQRYNQKFQDIEPDQEQPRILIIKPGNVCNLGCRMCNPATSTGLYQDFYKLNLAQKTFEGSFNEYTKNFEIIRESFSKHNEKIWPILQSWTDKLYFIDIYGGEPMLSPEMWNILQHAVNQDTAKNISLHYHTNCTIWNKKYIDLLKNFRSVNIGLSIDSHDPKQLEYIRHNSNYNEIIKIIELYKNLRKEFANIELSISLTITLYNIWDLDKIINGLALLEIPVHLNIVTTPTHYDIRHLPIPIKKHLINKFSNIEKLKIVNNFLEQTIPGCDIEWPKWKREVYNLDKIRNQSFSEVFPEWYSIIKQFSN